MPTVLHNLILNTSAVKKIDDVFVKRVVRGEDHNGIPHQAVQSLYTDPVSPAQVETEGLRFQVGAVFGR